jgi:hypothetical protein
VPVLVVFPRISMSASSVIRHFGFRISPSKLACSSVSFVHTAALILWFISCSGVKAVPILFMSSVFGRRRWCDELCPPPPGLPPRLPPCPRLSWCPSRPPLAPVSLAILS